MSHAVRVWLCGELEGRRLSRRQLASRAGLDPSTVSRIARGLGEPSHETVLKLIRALDLPSPLPVFHGPTQVERALRSDHVLTAEQVRSVMDHYLELRHRDAGHRRR